MSFLAASSTETFQKGAAGFLLSAQATNHIFDSPIALIIQKIMERLVVPVSVNPDFNHTKTLITETEHPCESRLSVH